MRKRIAGFCPHLEKECVIEVNYINSSTFEGEAYTKGRFSCDYKEIASCNPNTCPIYKRAPQDI